MDKRKEDFSTGSNATTTIIAVVLKTGGPYKYEHVITIYDQIKRNVSHSDYSFFCLTDDAGVHSKEFSHIVLTKNLPRQWSQIELFRPDIFTSGRQVFYLDLDTTIVGDITDIVAWRGSFCILRDLAKKLQHQPASGIMSFDSHGRNMAWNHWQLHKHQLIGDLDAGDGRVHGISKLFFNPLYIKHGLTFFQDEFPSKIVSYKKHCGSTNGKLNLPEGSRIVCYHGIPKPWEVERGKQENKTMENRE